jgi:hypothetical protein
MKILKDNNLLSVNPELCKEWDYNKNKLRPENYMPNCHDKVWWICKNNHKWLARIDHRNRGSNCPFCSGRLPTKENNLLVINPELCQEWDYNKNKLGPENYTSNSGKKIWWVCKNNHNWEATIDNRNKGKGCPYCCGKKISKENNLLIRNPEICKEWSNKNESGPEKHTPNSHDKVWWVCKNNHEWKTFISSRNNGSGCPFCSGRLSTKENNLLVINPEICKEWNYKKNKLGPENYPPNSHDKVWWICKKCNEGWRATIDNRNKGRGCCFCAGKKVSKENNLLTKNPEICKEWDYEKNELGPENYTSGLNKKVWWVCKNNHNWEATINSRNNGCGCRKCSKSISNLSQLWLDKLNIKIREFKIPYTNYIVDGYDPETNTIYEFYGDKWHGNPNMFNPSDINPCNKKPYSELYDKTIKRENIFKLMGYNLITIWESDFKKEQLKNEE